MNVIEHADGRREKPQYCSAGDIGGQRGRIMRKLCVALAIATICVIMAASPVGAKNRQVRGRTKVAAGVSLADAATAARSQAGEMCRKHKSATTARVLVTSDETTVVMLFDCEVAKQYRVTTTTTTTTTLPPTTTTPPPPPNPPCMTLDEFNQLQAGMTHDQVSAIVGAPGTLQAQTDIAGFHDEIWSWTGCSGLGANANASFQNGALQSKAQFGLR